MTPRTAKHVYRYEPVRKLVLNNAVMLDPDSLMTVLTDADPKIDQPVDVKVTLFEHQKTMVHRMGTVERMALSQRGLEGSPLTVVNHRAVRMSIAEQVFVNYAFLCDPIGAGKSYQMLTHLFLKPVLEPPMIIHAQTVGSLLHIRSCEFRAQFVHFKANLLVIPHSIMQQWKGYAALCAPKLRVVFIQTELDIVRLVGTNALRRKFWKDLETGRHQLLIVTNTFVDAFFRWFYNYRTPDLVKRAFQHMAWNRTSELFDHVPIHHELHKQLKAGVAEPEVAPGKVGAQVSAYKSKQTDAVLVEEAASMGEEKDFFYDTLLARFPDIALVNMSNVSMQTLVASHVCWNRVIYDEVDTIHLSSNNTGIPNAVFYWFITSSNGNLLYPYGMCEKTVTYNGFVNRKTPLFDFIQAIQAMPHVPQVHLMNDRDYVQACIQLPPMQSTTIRCKSHRITAVLQGDASMNEVREMIHAGDLAGLSAFFGCGLHKLDEVADVYFARLAKEVHNKEAELEYKRKISYDSEKHKEQTLRKIEEELRQLKTRMDGIMDKVKTIKDNPDCPICYDPVQKPVVVPCCNNVYCMPCLAKVIQMGRNRCACCRADIDTSKLTLVDTEPARKRAKVVVKMRTKLEQCLAELTEALGNPEHRVLLFSTYDGTFRTISDALETQKISFETIQGCGNQITSAIERFERGDNRLLFLNARHHAAGLNLPMTTHLIIYNCMSDNMRMQVIGRAQRMGRKSPLQVIQLLNEDE